MHHGAADVDLDQLPDGLDGHVGQLIPLALVAAVSTLRSGTPRRSSTSNPASTRSVVLFELQFDHEPQWFLEGQCKVDLRRMRAPGPALRAARGAAVERTVVLLTRALRALRLAAPPASLASLL